MKTIGARVLALVTILAAAAPQVACAPAATTKAQTEADAMRREATADRLEATGDQAADIGDMTRAEQYYVAAMKIGASEGRGRERLLSQKLVAVCAADGRYPAAIQYANDYLAKHPNDVDVRFASAALSAAIGDTESARAGFERVVSLKPEHAEAHYALASILADEGDAHAGEHFRTYLSMQPRGAYAESARAQLLRTMSVQ
jgi:tetratricopeptide (TPR) repeat protein